MLSLSTFLEKLEFFLDLRSISYSELSNWVANHNLDFIVFSSASIRQEKHNMMYEIDNTLCTWTVGRTYFAGTR